jgi:transketolase C-terminal domain/subunit
VTGFSPDELRLIGVAGPVWLRMLRAREVRIVDKMYGEFRNGKTDHLSALAELACVRDQINEITNAIGQLENLKE